MASVSGIYSQKIFADFGFAVLTEEFYEDLKDMWGNLVISDPGEHRSAKLVYLSLREKNTNTPLPDQDVLLPNAVDS